MALSISEIDHITSFRHLEILGSYIQRDQNENKILMMQLQAGHLRIRYPMKQKYRENLEQIERIVANYEVFKDQNNIFQYLRAISYKIKLRLQEEEEQEE